MYVNLRLQRLSILGLACLVIPNIAGIGITQPRVSAQIGIQIQSNGGTTRARAKHRVKVGDGLRVYVVPAEDAYIYVIRTDKKTARALSPQPDKIPAKTAIILPNQGQFYNIDGASNTESFTIICSPMELKEVQELIGSPPVPYLKWAAVEQKLIEQSRIELTEDVTKPFSIAGVVRHLSNDEEFLNQLPMTSGNTLVVKTYDFTVKK